MLCSFLSPSSAAISKVFVANHSARKDRTTSRFGKNAVSFKFCQQFLAK
jgi:hypothetical protein